ncbi:MAG: chromosome partitioning protein [Desulfobacterales bacterium RIFOXYA12_FULL_46_15]|nr:MAG: chromosome partitioning protein [Desulfobacula sp. GWF2_41_7]OGR23235.1 MAG: chromosome partitioning protein [Desulfobacterales bacterium RIFOXYA12_FULL_46_15]
MHHSPNTTEEMKKRHAPIGNAMKNINYKIAIISGKGGVGKTGTVVNLAAEFRKRGMEIGIFDADVHGPSVPKMVGVKTEMRDILRGSHGIDPVVTEQGLKVMSVALIWPAETTPVMWRGQYKARVLRQFLSSVKWNELDMLFIDLPPGTGDEPITIMKSIPDLDGMVVVTTPQEISTIVCSKAINAAKELNAPILGLVENMNAYQCPDCGRLEYFFGKDRGEKLAKTFKIPFLGGIPMDGEYSESADKGVPIVFEKPESLTAKAFSKIADELIKQLPQKEKIMVKHHDWEEDRDHHQKMGGKW